jgi:hypothetical protein
MNEEISLYRRILTAYTVKGSSMDMVKRIFRLFSVIGIYILIGSCQNRIRFQFAPEAYPVRPLHLPIVKDRDLWPAVTIMINDEKIRLHVDSGHESAAISLTKEQIKRTNLRKLNKTRTVLNARGKKQVLHAYIADEVVIDGHPFTHCEIMEMPSASDQFDDIGLIGLGFFQSFTVCFDFKNDLIKLYPPKHEVDIENWQAIHLDHQNRFQARLSGYDRVFNVGLDTGALYVHGEKGYNWIRVAEKELVGAFDSHTEYDFNVISSDLVASEDVGMHDLLFLIYETAEPKGVDLFLGYDFFLKYQVIVDYQASILYFR